jgi:hypothetical protein
MALGLYFHRREACTSWARTCGAQLQYELKYGYRENELIVSTTALNILSIMMQSKTPELESAADAVRRPFEMLAVGSRFRFMGEETSLEH